MNKVLRWVFRYVGNKTFDFSSKKKDFLPKFGPKLAFLVNLGQPMQANSVTCWWVGWWLIYFICALIFLLRNLRQFLEIGLFKSKSRFSF